MKVTMFHFMPYRDLPESFPDKLHSAWIDAPWWQYGDANKVRTGSCAIRIFLGRSSPR
jgi:hypothetical protein